MELHKSSLLLSYFYVIQLRLNMVGFLTTTIRIHEHLIKLFFVLTRRRLPKNVV